MKEDNIPLDEVRECLERSGYLLESRLVRALSKQGYFVEPNQVVLDPRTNKSREIDLVAERFHYAPEFPKVVTITHFVIEALNNKLPFVLTTPRPYSPAADIESYLKYVCTPHDNPFEEAIDICEEKGAFKDNLFSQYCALSRKNNSKELMASHPDDVYGSLLKMSEYVESQMVEWGSRGHLQADGYWRWLFWQPMLVLGGQLVEVNLSEDGSPTLKETAVGRLEFNWHAGDQRKTTVIEVITEEYFLNRLDAVVQKDCEIAGKMFQIRQKR